MSYLLLLETATDSCSVALADGTTLLAEKYAFIPKAHDTLLASFTQEILQENSLTAGDCAAVAVSEGPGSYMGLRIAASLAKGIAYGANIKLIGVSTLAVIAQCAIDNNLFEKCLGAAQRHGMNLPDASAAGDYLIVPMIDAGRMEVYTAVFNSTGQALTPTEAKILTPDSFKEELLQKPVLFTGNGAAKFQQLLLEEGDNAQMRHAIQEIQVQVQAKQQQVQEDSYKKNAFFAEQLPHASGIRVQAFNALQNGKEADKAYFQPFYLKDFIPGKSKKLL